MARPDKQAKPTKPAKEPRPAREGWSPAVRWVVSFVIAWHLFVIFLAPMSYLRTSPLVRSVAQSPYVRWYTDPLYLNQGYSFFGPDPPQWGQLVRYEVFDSGGRAVESGEFPNLDQQWPRLWYHRHMMLADQASAVGVLGDPDRDLELMLRAYARALVRKHRGVEARVQYVRHLSLHPADVRGDVNPDAPSEPADPNDERYFEVQMTVVERSTGEEETRFERPLLPEAAPTSQSLEEIPIGVGG